MGQKPSHSHYEKFKDGDGFEIPYPQEDNDNQSTTNCYETCCDRCCNTILLLCIMKPL